MQFLRFYQNMIFLVVGTLVGAIGFQMSILMAHGSERTCLSKALAKELSSYEGDSVHAVDVQEGVYGGKRIAIEKKSTEEQWLARSRNLLPPQGDPRWNYMALPTCLRDFLGFKKVSDTRYVIPDRAELMGAIGAFNTLASTTSLTQIKHNLYDENQLHADEVGFLTSFEDGGIPIATNGSFFYHDMSHHSLYGVFVTDRLDRHAKNQVRYLMKFFDTLALEHPELARSEAFKYVYRTIVKDVAKSIDLGTGALPQALAEGFGNRVDIGNISRLVSNGESAKELLESKINENFFRATISKYDEYRADFVPVLKTLKKFVDQNKVKPEFTGRLARTSPLEIKSEIQSRLHMLEEDCLRAIAAGKRR